MKLTNKDLKGLRELLEKRDTADEEQVIKIDNGIAKVHKLFRVI